MYVRHASPEWFRYFGRATFLLRCVWLLTVAVACGAEKPRFPNCLNASEQPAESRPPKKDTCGSDALSLGRDETISNARRFLGIDQGELSFAGCASAVFRTVPSETPELTLRVYYPTGIGLAHAAYIGPLIHELAHVFQFTRAGSLSKLMASHEESIERVELGADFIAGITAARLNLEPRAFLINLSIVGTYGLPARDSHGRPEDRAAAFRSGYFYQNKNLSLEDSYSDFQDNRFAQIKHNSGGE